MTSFKEINNRLQRLSFRSGSESTFDYSYLIDPLRRRLRIIGDPRTDHYSAHTVQHAADNGILDEDIQHLGRWSSCTSTLASTSVSLQEWPHCSPCSDMSLGGGPDSYQACLPARYSGSLCLTRLITFHTVLDMDNAWFFGGTQLCHHEKRCQRCLS
jgi:hypothetical protein